jgi:hypothetical protein
MSTTIQEQKNGRKTLNDKKISVESESASQQRV